MYLQYTYLLVRLSRGAGMAKRGRPKASEERQRHEAVIKAAFEELVEKGYEKTTMLGIAKRAKASKETLYAWFGNKEGLFAALIKYQAQTTVARLSGVVTANEKPQETLVSFANGFLKLLLGEPSVSLNRAAMASPELATVLLKHGRYTAGPIIEGYLAELSKKNYLNIDNVAESFQVLYGLIIQDLQIRVLLGEDPPDNNARQHHAELAIEKFLSLYQN